MNAKNKKVIFNKPKVNIEEVWVRAKKNFIIGKDYIESEANDEYIVFSVFNYALLTTLREDPFL